MRPPGAERHGTSLMHTPVRHERQHLSCCPGFGMSVRREIFAATTPQVVQLEVLGMHCSACSTAVEASLGELPGVLHSSISLILRKANVRIDPSLVTHVSVG